MNIKLPIALFLSLFASAVFTKDSIPKPTPIKRVLYITLDGIRWQDVLNIKQNMPVFWNKYAPEAKIYGGLNQTDHTMEVASTPISLPSYQSQMSGTVTECQDNECGSIKLQTFPEYLVNNLHFHPADVVAISCWDRMEFALEQHKGTITSSSGIQPMTDPYTHLPDFEMQLINSLQSVDYRRSDERLDRYSFMHALHYLKKYKPKFMYLALGEADNYAHAGDRDAYLRTIAYYDQVLDVLFSTLKDMSLYNETLIIVTTDHGRGFGKEWRHHGDQYKGSKKTWAFVLNGELVYTDSQNGVKQYSTLSIRPTVEKVFN